MTALPDDDPRAKAIARAQEPGHWLHPYWKAGHDLATLFAHEHNYRCARCGAAQIDLSEDMGYGPVSLCKLPALHDMRGAG